MNEEKILFYHSNPEQIQQLIKFFTENNYLCLTAFNEGDLFTKAVQIQPDYFIIGENSFSKDISEIASLLRKKSPFSTIAVITSKDRDNKLELINEIEVLISIPNDLDNLPLLLPKMRRFHQFYKQLEAIKECMEKLVEIIDTKDKYTQGHTERVTKLSVILAQRLNLDNDLVQEIKQAAILHDIGKLGVPDEILNKPSVLTEEEFALVRKHPVLSEKICSNIQLFKPILPYIRHHHERIDGKGYPDGLLGDEIPLGAKVIAVADSYDAMATDRPYRPLIPRERIISILESGKGKQWDEKIIEVLIELIRNNEI